MRRLFLTLIIGSIVCAPALAGPITPPPGPVTSTHKTLTEVEPRIAINATNTPGDADSLFKITQPGSYYLTGNITGESGKHGIEITASGVTLDLNGFDLVGIPGMGAFDGVAVRTASLSSITLINGSVRGWGDSGVDLDFFPPENCRIAGVIAEGNASRGIDASGGTIVENCAAANNGSHGIEVSGNGSAVLNSTAHDNVGDGIRVAVGCLVAHCASANNAGSGIWASLACSIIDCNVRLNSSGGITCGSDCVVRGNTCANNRQGSVGAGIQATGIRNRIEGNACILNAIGIDVDGVDNFIVKNTCTANDTNWTIVAGNTCLVVIGTNAAAINGSSGGTAPGSTDPNANFTH
jgi:hypothetical protein